MTILIVDDQEEVPRSLRGVLERAGYRVLAAGSADAALAVLADETVDLLLVDQVMPGRSGSELIAEIRSTRPLLPIILHTGYSGERPPAELVDALSLQGYHDKADGPEALLVWIAAACKTQRALSDLHRQARHHEQLLAEVSHELRAPLQCISGFADLLVEEARAALPETAHAPLRSLARAAHQLNDLVGHCLTRARLDARALTLSPRQVAVQDLAEELCAGAERLLGSGVRFAVDTRLAPAALHTDPEALRAILRNLIGNAGERTAQGTITLRIAHAQGTVRLSVADSGPRLDADHLARVLATDARGADGLGLALSRQLAQLLGGDLTADDGPDGGAVFALVLPDHAAHPSADGALDAPSDRAAPDPSLHPDLGWGAR